MPNPRPDESPNPSPRPSTPAGATGTGSNDGDAPAERVASAGEITRALEAHRRAGGDPRADDELLRLVHDQLHAIARRRMGDERAAHTLQATALVNEAYLKLVAGGGASGPGGWADRAAFFRAAAEAMRRILIDHARRRGSAKRGAGRAPMPIDVVDLAGSYEPESVLALDEAMVRLEQEDARAAEVVRLRFYAGLEVDEVAEIMGISPRTVAREWVYARSRLYELLVS